MKFAPFAGKRIGLITNHSGLDRKGRRNIDLMREAGVNIAAIFSPEHGFLGKEDRPEYRGQRPIQARASKYSASTAPPIGRRRRC